MKKLIRNILLLSIFLVIIGNVAYTQCNAPTLQPTNLILTSTTNSVSGIFNAAMDADHYLIVRSTMSTLNSTPVNGTTYAASNSLGGGTVAAYQTDTIISDTNLYAGTQYFYFVFAATSLSCSGGPAYLITSPLIGTITCPLKSLNITAILQEYYNTSTDLMNQTLGINWDTGDLFHNFGSAIVDTVTVFIRSTSYPNYVIEATYNGLNLNTNGSIQTIYLNSNWNACPYGAITGYHHIVIKHRNSIETWSDSVDFSGQQINYNFFTHTPVEFAGGMYEDGNGNFEIWGGDVNQNGNLESEDCTLIYVAANSDDETVNNGYVICDIDGNGNIDTQDYGLAYNNANSGANTINFLVYPTQPSGLTLTPNYSTVTGSFSASETADHYLIVRSTNSTLSALPVKGTTYTAGNTIGGGIVVAYQKGTSFTDTSLNSGTQYYYIFASDTLYCTHSYLTASPLTGNVFINCGIPLAQPTVLTLSNNGNSISGSFTASASADHYLIVRSTIDPLTAIPVNGTTYTTGTSLGSGTVVAYQTGTTFTDNDVITCTQYYYNVFAANCTSSPQYLITNPITNNIEIPYNNAITLSSTDTIIQLSTTDSVVWYIYHANTTHLLIKRAFMVGASTDTIIKMYIYTGICSNLTLIDSVHNSSKGLYVNNLTIGNNYFIKIINSKLLPPNNIYYFNPGDILNCWESTCHDNDNPNYPSPDYSYVCDYICNGSFEYYNTNPPNGLSQIGLACPWGSANDATPDYYNGAAIGGGGNSWAAEVPQNYLGYQADYIPNHKGYAGILIEQGSDWREYIYQRLKNPLKAGITYTVSLKVSRADYAQYSIDNFGVFFSNYDPYNSMDTPPWYTSYIDYIPDQTWIWKNNYPGTYLEDATNWTTISFNFTPTLAMEDWLGEIKFITIGAFGIPNFQPETVTPPIIGNHQYSAEPGAYYYIDEVHIVPTATIIGNSNPCTNVPNTYTYTTEGSMSDYVWTVVGGSITAGGTSTSNFATVTWTSSGPQYISVSYNNDGCIVSTTYNVTVMESPTPTITTTTLYIYTNTPTTFTTETSMSGYAWAISGTTNISGVNTSIVTITWPTSGTYTVSVSYSNGECMGTTTINVTVISPTPITINGSIDCQKWAGTFYFNIPTNPAPPSGTIWQWSVPSGATITSVNGTNSITVDWGNAGSGIIIVEGIYQGNILYYGVFPIFQNCIANVQYEADAILNTNTSTLFVNAYNGGAASFTTSSTIYINGIFTVDQDLFFDNCPNIIMSPNAKIIVNHGVNLLFRDSHIYGCDCIWDGIYVQDPSEEVRLENTIVQDAKNAIVSINNGYFGISNNTIFRNNLIGIWVKDYNSESNGTAIHHQGIVIGTTFEYNSGSPVLFSSNAIQSMIGIEVDRVFQLTIGDNTNASYVNFFKKLKYGIKILNSDVNIYNNNFSQIPITSTNPPSYSGTYAEANVAAIYSTKDFNVVYGLTPYLYFTNQIKIGDNSVNFINRFAACDIGIFGVNIKPDIENNIFDPQHYTGIHLKDCSDGATINNNTFDMDENYWSSSLLYNSSIIVEYPTTSLVHPLDISYNTINETRTGIFLINCGNISTTCNIHDNFINFDNVDFQYHYMGIRSTNGKYENIEKNNITYNSTPTLSCTSKLNGIYLRSVTNSFVRSNRLENLGTGLFVGDVSTATQFWCNNFISCWYGINLYAQISTQVYNPHKATDNIWHDANYPNSYLYRVTGNLLSTYHPNWFFQGPNANTSNIWSPYIYINNSLLGHINPIQNSTEGNACLNNKSSTSIEPIDRTDLLQSIVLDSLVYDTLSAENKYSAKTFAYRFLDDNPDYLNLGTADDSIYNNFYDTTRTTGIGKLYDVEKLIMNRNYANADSLNSILTGINLMETNQIEVNRIYLTKLILDTISSIDSLSLVNIAYQSPQTGGKGVYGARVILGVDVDTSDNMLPKSLIQQENNKKTSSTSDIKVYPNPANNLLYIEFDNITDGSARVEFYDFTGKLHYSTSINTALKLQTLNINSIKAGIYNLRITTTTKINNQKLVIIK